MSRRYPWVNPNSRSSWHMFYKAAGCIADRDEVFTEIMRGPNPLTPDELRRLVEKDPQRYGHYKR